MAIVAIDGRKYFDYGIGTYIQQLVKGLSKIHSDHKYLLFVNTQDSRKITLPKGWQKEEVPYRKYSAGEVVLLGLYAKKMGVQVFHAPHYTLPFGLKHRSLVTIHDIIHLRFPEYFGLAKRAYAHAMIFHALNSSKLVAADSEYTKLDILKTFRVSENKIKVICLGVGDQYKRIRERRTIEEYKRKFALQRPHILFVGNLMPHKGLSLLLRAIRELVSSIDVDLAIVGGSLRSDETLLRQATEFGILDRIKDVGRISNEDLVTAYNAAEVLVMPSFYEGFGLPALEAMACGTPVVVSNAASLPEVAGDAAMIFKSGDAKELVDSLMSVLKEAGTRRKMIREGMKHVRKFTWGKAARETLALYDQIAGD